MLCALARHYRDLGARGPAVFIGSRRYSAQELLENSCSYYRRAAELASALSTVSSNLADRHYPVCASSAWYGLGLLRLEMGDITDAIVGFRNAMFAGHKHAPHNLGNLLLKQGHLQDALTAFEEGARRGDSAAANNAAQLTIRVNGDFASAQMWYERATELGSTTAPGNLARLLALGQSNNVPRDLQRAKELVAIARERGQNDGMDDLIRTIDELGVSADREPTTMEQGNSVIEMPDVIEMRTRPKVIQPLHSPIDVRDRMVCVQDAVMRTAPPHSQYAPQMIDLKKENASRAFCSGSPRKRIASFVLPGNGLKQRRNRTECGITLLKMLPVVPIVHPWIKPDFHAWMRELVSPLYSFAWRDLAERRVGDVGTVVAKRIENAGGGRMVHVAKGVRAIISAAQTVLRGNSFISVLYKWRAIAVPRHVAFAEVIAAQIFCLEHRYVQVGYPVSSALIAPMDEKESGFEMVEDGNGWVAMEF